MNILRVTLSWAARAGMLAIVLYGAREQSLAIFLAASAALALAFLPLIVQRNTRAHLPWTLDASVSLALLLDTAGIAFNLYHSPEWWWWDELTHALGSFVVGMIAFHLVFTLNWLGKVVMSAPMLGLFILLSAMGVGGLWEIAEFQADIWLGTNTQISLHNTMQDLQFDLVGGVLIAGVAMRYFYRKRESGGLMR